jgi:hypothetical protein
MVRRENRPLECRPVAGFIEKLYEFDIDKMCVEYENRYSLPNVVTANGALRGL